MIETVQREREELRYQQEMLREQCAKLPAREEWPNIKKGLIENLQEFDEQE